MIIRQRDSFAGLKSGAKWGAAIGGGLGFMGGGLFGALPMALLGAAGGAVVGGLKDLFSPSYRDLQTAYDPGLLGYPSAQTANYGGYPMPNALYGHSQAQLYPQSYAPYQQPFVMQEQPRGPGFGTGMLLGAGLGAFSLPMLGWGMMGMGGLGMMGMMGMGGLGMMGMMGMGGLGMMGMGGFGFGGFGW